MTSEPFAWGLPEIASLQLSALSLLIESRLEDSPDLRKRSDLRESAYVPRRRHVLTDPAEIRKKHAIEMGFNWLTGQMLPAPLEPWTGPPGSERIYNQLMRRGPSRLQDYSGPDLAVIEWLTQEELAANVPGENGMMIVALSDGKADEQRRYPGAPVPDKRAGIGKQLRGNMEGIILGALVNVCSGRTVRRARGKGSRHGALCTADGTPVTAAQVASEANAIKARRHDLDEYRWVSLSRTREIIRKLIRAGFIEEIRPPRPVRQKRSWRTLARVIRCLVSAPEPVPLLPPAGAPRQRRLQRPPVIRAQPLPHLHLVHAVERRPRARGAPRVEAPRDPRPQVPHRGQRPDALRRRLARPRHGDPPGARSGRSSRRHMTSGGRCASRSR